MKHSDTQTAADRYDAIHRAVLAGMLSNIGTRGVGHEYQGPRGLKFHLFPGSGLFKQAPKWVLAAELIETARLYARTVARIEPEWIEQAAGALAKRTYTEPHFDIERQTVMAYERVGLYGLVLVPRRAVAFGPVDAIAARELFIREALVHGLARTGAPFFRHNRELIERVQQIEAKQRRRDVLVDPQVIYDFYDSRIPRGIFSTRLLDQWRNRQGPAGKRALFMAPSDLMMHEAGSVTAERFPAMLEIEGLRLGLEYRFEPGEMDGVTATVPLGVLNQVPVDQTEWLVPGMLEEKIAELIRTLPKALRVQFVPVPEVAREAATMLTSGEGSLLEALALFLGRRSGSAIGTKAFDTGQIPEYLRMNFRVIDQEGRQVALGRDLAAIRRQLGVVARQTFARMPPSPWIRDDVRRWDFGDLPDRIEVRRHGMTVNGYPALVADVPAREQVSLRVLDTPELAAAAHRAGVRRLFMLQLASEAQYLQRHWPDIERLCLWYAPLGTCDGLKADLLTSVADRALFRDGEAVRTQSQFVSRAQSGWNRLSDAAHELSGSVGQALRGYHEASLRLAAEGVPLLAPSLADMREQLANLVYRGFVAHTPFDRLEMLPRYIQGVLVRLEKLNNAGLRRDQAALEQVRPLWEGYLVRVSEHRALGLRDPELARYRWMLEEWRISLFAQELKTAMPISERRLGEQWGKIRG